MQALLYNRMRAYAQDSSLVISMELQFLIVTWSRLRMFKIRIVAQVQVQQANGVIGALMSLGGTDNYRNSGGDVAEEEKAEESPSEFRKL
jgi:hypothetical protein